MDTTIKYNKEFVPYDLSIELLNIGFDCDNTLGYYESYLKGSKPEIFICIHNRTNKDFIKWNTSTCALAPLWQQAFDWFENQHGIFGQINKEGIESDGWVYTYHISYVPKEFENAKRRVPHQIDFHSLFIGGATYSGGWDKLIEAKLALLNKLIDIYKKDRL